MTAVLPVLRQPSAADGAGGVGPPSGPADTGVAVPLTRFVGRVTDVTEVARQVSQARLVTLVGPGGSGKTRLALAVCDRLPDAVRSALSWVELAELDDPALLEQTVAAGASVADTPGSSPVRALVRHLQGRAAVLVLDNCEHLVAAVATLASHLLRSCPGLRVLATSREPLGVAGETTWAVGGLSLPAPPGGSAAELSGSEAVQLFEDRARLVHPGFEITDRNAAAVAELCRRLDGMPLALELAAARLRVLPLAQVVDRLDDVFSLLVTSVRDVAPRHQTLRATLDWSYQLLPPPERRLFAELSVFRGGFTVESAEAVATAGSAGGPVAEAGSDGATGRGGGGEVFGLLARLVEKSLVQVHSDGEDERCRLLEVVRQYADERLGPDRPAAAGRHAAHYLHLAERAEQQLAAGEQKLWLDRLNRDQDNLRAALTWARRHDPRLGLRLAGALGRYWRVRGNYAEGREWLQAAISAAEASTPPTVYVKALIALGMLEFLLCEYGGASARLRQALELSRPLGEPRTVATALQVLGSIAREQGQYAEARDRHEECLAIWQELGDPAGVARSLKSLGFTAWLEADYARAGRHSTEALRRFRDLGDGAGVVGALVDLGAAAHRQGERIRARALLKESFALSERLGSREGTAWSLEQLGLLAAAGNDRREAVRLLRASVTVHYELGDRCRTAGALEALAGELAAGPDARTAACLFAAAAEARTAIGAPVPPCDRADHERRRQAIEAALDPGELAAAFAEGHAISLEQAVAAAGAVPDAADPPVVPRGPGVTVPGRPGAAALGRPGAALLRVHALGRARVELDGRALGPQDWTYAKPRELLYYLLTRPGSGKAEIGLALWPDASGKELRNSFHTGVKYLRRALGGQQWVRFADGGYSIERTRPLWYDVTHFETAAEQALAAEPTLEAVPALKEAAARYPGDFLADLAAGGWADGQRERLRRRYEQVMLALGRLLGSHRRFGEAAETFARLVDHDPLLEMAHRGLMRCHAALGNRARAVRQYQELVELLSAQVGTAPAPETTALYTSLRHGPKSPPGPHNGH